MRFCFRAVAGLMAVAWALPVVVGQPPGAGGPASAAPGGPARPAKPQLKVKVFKLERGDPQTVIDSLNALLEEPNAAALPPMAPGGTPGTPAPGGLQGGFAGVPAPAVGATGFGGMPPAGAIGCFFGSGGVNATPVWRATAQVRTRAVVVRGSDRHLNVAADLVALLDRPANAPLPKLHVVKAFPLKHATAEELGEVITALSFDDVKLATPGEHLLAIIAPDDVASSIAELVKELDMPGAGDTDRKPKPKRGQKAKETSLPQ
jgi:hypothetical protein